MTTTVPTATATLALTRPATASSTRAMLRAGVIAGPLFLGTIIIQQLTREGVNAKIQPLSMLSLGDNGWIQITNFIVSGLLVLASAVGMRRVLRNRPAGTWGPILFTVYGVALLVGGAFLVDPANGFPAGAPGGTPDPSTWSWHSTVHAFAAPTVGLALFAACFVFARRFLRTGQRGLAITSLAIAVAYFVTVGTGLGMGDFRIVLAAGGLLWLSASALCAYLLSNQPAAA